MEPDVPARVVTLVLVGADGRVLGRLPAFVVDTPWWQDAGPVVSGARALFGIDATILRLLETELSAPPGGAVTYLAEVDAARVAEGLGATALRPWSGSLPDDPVRRPYARPGGPGADLAWADAALTAAGLTRTAPAEQVRTWNLSSLWRLPTTDGGAWLKVVPPFSAHEGALLTLLGGEAVPRLLGHDGERMLLSEIEGDDQYAAGGPTLTKMVDMLVAIQTTWLGRIDEILRRGLPDWRSGPLAGAIGGVVERASPSLPPADRIALRAFVDALPVRLRAIGACGIDDTLVHGDFHPGNVRGTPGRLTLLDWGDSGVGHPLLDQSAFLTRIEPSEVAHVREHWHGAWRRAVPGCDPDRAAGLLTPIAAARQAVIYQRFLDSIEAAERVYHRADVPDWLERTAAVLREERAAG